MTDKEMLDFLEEQIEQEPILLHNLNGGEEFPSHPRGLGLMPFAPRTLREAIEQMAGRRFRAAVIPDNKAADEKDKE